MAILDTYEQLCRHVRETTLLKSALDVLEWDERTCLPTAAGPYRAEQITYLSGLIHRRRVDPRLGDWLDELTASPKDADRHGDHSTTIRRIKREYDKQVKLPQSLVEETARVSVLGQQAWVEARKRSEFSILQPYLEHLVSLKRQYADAVGYDACPYDALLDDYEPEVDTASVATVLESLRKQLVPLVSAIAECQRPDTRVLARSFPIAAQQSFGRTAAEKIGFDFARGRLDVTHHPFCTSTGPDDCRITTRYDEQFFPTAFFGILHEAGHGIYDQGLRRDMYGLPPGTYVSMGIHESQSRMWENLVGRSRAFWEHFFPLARATFPALADVSLDEFYFAINDVQPSLIRVEADEATYNLHIILRFELEQSLLDGDLTVCDLPLAWREKYRHYLQIEPAVDSDGVLQDIHWSAGLFGYFPTYALGNLYAAHFFEQAGRVLGDLDAQFAAGDFQTLRRWLQTQIHQRGQCYSAAELADVVGGRPLTAEPLVSHLTRKLAPLYGLG